MTTVEKQLHRDTVYIQAYQAWISSLPPEQRVELKVRRLATPDTKRSTGKIDDHRVLALASASADTTRDDTSAVAEIRRTAADALASFCARVRSHPNPLLAFDALCFASGLMEVEGLSQTALARRHGVTKSAFSKQVRIWIDLFDLPVPRGCRSVRAQLSHGQARLDYVRRTQGTRPSPESAGGIRRRRRYASRADDPTVVFIRGLDSFRIWFRRRTRRLPIRRWTPEARRFLRNELAWFKNLHDRLGR